MTEVFEKQLRIRISDSNEWRFFNLMSSFSELHEFVNDDIESLKRHSLLLLIFILNGISYFTS